MASNTVKIPKQHAIGNKKAASCRCGFFVANNLAFIELYYHHKKTMPKRDQIRTHLTPYADVNEIIAFFTNQVIPIFAENLAGIYLTGSLSYRAFNYDTSDIDLTVIIEQPISSNELAELKQFHIQMENKYKEWAKRLECTYTPKGMLPNTNPPQKPRPWYWGGDATLYEEAPYGNEWITNTYLLYEKSISLFGPEFKTLRSPVDIEDVQKACIRDLFQEWKPKKTNRDWFVDNLANNGEI